MANSVKLEQDCSSTTNYIPKSEIKAKDDMNSLDFSRNTAVRNYEEKFSKSKYQSWWILPIYMFLVINSGSIFWGWAGGFREMFFKMNAYSWIENEDRRDTNIGYLLTTASLSNLISDIFVGNILDFFGPRYTLISGIFVRFIGWLLIGASSQQLQLYLVGMILIGGSTDLIYFPFCSYGTLFDNKKGIIISLLGASMSFSSIVPILIYRIWEDLVPNMGAFLYLTIYAIGWLVMMLIAAFFLFPKKGFRETVYKFSTERLQVINSSNNMNIESSAPKQSIWDKIIIWCKPVLRPSFLVLIPIGCFLILRSEYAQRNTFRDIPLTYDFWVIISPLRFFPCAVMGIISDYLGHRQTMFLFEGMAAVLFFANFFEGLFPDIISTVMLFFFTSWIMTSQYVFIGKTQPSAEFGRLCGTIALIAGAFLFLNIFIAPWTETDIGRLVVGIFMLALSGVNALILLSTFFFNYKLNFKVNT